MKCLEMHRFIANAVSARRCNAQAQRQRAVTRSITPSPPRRLVTKNGSSRSKPIARCWSWFATGPVSGGADQPAFSSQSLPLVEFRAAPRRFSRVTTTASARSVGLHLYQSATQSRIATSQDFREDEPLLADHVAAARAQLLGLGEDVLLRILLRHHTGSPRIGHRLQPPPGH